MTSYPLTDDSASGLDRPLSNLYSFFVNPPSLAGLVEVTKNKSLDVVVYIQSLVSNDVSTQPDPRIASPELRDAESWTLTDRDVAHSVEQPGSALEARPSNHYSLLNPGVDGSQETGQPVQVQGHEADDARPRYRKLTWMGWSAFIFGLLLAIMVPGLIVGIVTKQFPWGIATSGAVTPVGVYLGGAFLKRRE